MKCIMRVRECEYDGYVVVHCNDGVFCYEGWDLVPTRVKKWVDKNGCLKVSKFHWEVF